MGSEMCIRDRLIGLNLKDTSKFAFLLSIPTILGALILMFLKGAFLLELNDLLIILTGFFGSAFVAFFTIKSFLKFVEKIGMTPFVLYRVALGAVAPTAVLVEEAAKILIGSKLEDDVIDKAVIACENACNPIDDKRGTVEYRKKVSGVLFKRALKIAVERANIG